MDTCLGVSVARQHGRGRSIDRCTHTDLPRVSTVAVSGWHGVWFALLKAQQDACKECVCQRTEL